MRHFPQNLRLLLIPFLLIFVGFIAVYTLFDWYVFIKLDAWHLREDLYLIIFPLVLSVIPIFLLLWKPMQRVAINQSNNRWGFLVMAAFFIGIPSAILQNYMAVMTGKLTVCESVHTMPLGELTKYYAFRHHYISKSKFGVDKAADVSGKRSQDFNMHYFLALPIFEKPSDTSRLECSYWLAVKYDKTISNRLSDSAKIAAFRSFVRKSHDEFLHTDFDRFSYLEVMGNTGDKRPFKRAAHRSDLVSYDGPFIFQPHTGRFEDRGDRSLKAFLIVSGIVILLWMLIASTRRLIPPVQKKR